MVELPQFRSQLAKRPRQWWAAESAVATCSPGAVDGKGPMAMDILWLIVMGL